MIHLNKNSSTSALDLENSLQQPLTTLSKFRHLDINVYLLNEGVTVDFDVPEFLDPGHKCWTLDSGRM